MSIVTERTSRRNASRASRYILFGGKRVLIYSAMSGTVGERVLREIADPSSALSNAREFQAWSGNTCHGVVTREADGQEFSVILKLDVVEGVHIQEGDGRDWSNKPVNLSSCIPDGVGPYVVMVGKDIETTTRGENRPSIIRTIANQLVATWTLRGFGWTTVHPEPNEWDRQHNNVEIHCPWAYGFDKGRKYRESSAGHTLTLKTVGAWKTTMSSEVVTITARQAAVLEELLADYLRIVQTQYPTDYGPMFSFGKWGIPSVAVRFDMSPFEGDTASAVAPHVYEVEGNTAGLGFSEMLGLDTCQQVAALLDRSGINHIGSFVTACRAPQLDEHELMLQRLERHGITVSRTGLGETDGLPVDIPVWGRTGEEDAEHFGHLQARSLILFRDGGGHKRYLVNRFGATYLDNPALTRPDQLKGDFSNGFVVKPWRSWGTKDVNIWSPDAPYSRKCNWKQIDRDVGAILADSQAKAAHIVQPFSPPTFEDGWYRIWRIFGIWDGERYRVTGGLWNDRRSLLVHGANDARFGAIKVT